MDLRNPRPGRAGLASRALPPCRDLRRPLKKSESVAVLPDARSPSSKLSSGFARGSSRRLRLESSSDRVEVDEDGGPEGLERRLALAEVAALAPSVAVDDESEQPLDARPGAGEMVALGGIG